MFVVLSIVVATTRCTLLADSLELEGARSVGAVQMLSIYGRHRLRGTASPPSLQRSSWPPTDRPSLADALEGVRSVGAVEPVFNLRLATAARDRSPPGLHRSSVPPTDGPLLADSLEGVRSVGAV